MIAEARVIEEETMMTVVAGVTEETGTRVETAGATGENETKNETRKKGNPVRRIKRRRQSRISTWESRKIRRR